MVPPAIPPGGAVTGGGGYAASAGGHGGGPFSLEVGIWGFLGRSLLMMIGMLLVIPAPWVATMLYRYIVEHVRVPAGSGDDRERRHESLRVAAFEIGARNMSRARDQTPELPIGLGRMRHQHQLVCRVKGHERTEIPSAAEEVTKLSIRKHPLDEVLPQPRV